MVSSAPATVLEVSVSHEDSAISNLRDQDYLSLRVGKGKVVRLQQRLSNVWWLTYANKSEKRESGTVVKLAMIKK